ncbi:MAG: DNA repair protein rad50 [Trizodia sp. TS-e1964]|nr:MAG: DNA repair protein rad50 [Trizodia sp. TS-e1964]
MTSRAISVPTQAKIEKLSILGVRSFDNTRSEAIKFNSPLTLIVGYNGSGKTTIIECLKYATTGDLPPNSKGGAFIHDPKLCGEKEVLAQVKLAFSSTSGAKLVVTRSLQLTVKKTTRQQKTLEGQLVVINNGERSALSSRVAELDQVMPLYLGTSKAVLDSVIFCHQDESLWPMSEPSVLKKKFDEIFEAMKYTKAIENLKVLKKKLKEELGKFKLLEQQYKIDKDRSDKAEKQSKQLQNEIEDLREECKDLTEKISHATSEADRLWAQTAAFENIISTLNARRIEKRGKQESINDFRQHMQEMEDSDEWLTSTLAQYEDRMSTYRQHIEVQKGHYTHLKDEINITRNRLGAKMTEEGKRNAEKEHHEKQTEIRGQLIKEAARRHNIWGFDSELDGLQIQDFMQKLMKLSRDQNLQLERLKRDTREELQSAQNTLNELVTRRSTLDQVKTYAKQEISKNDRKATEVQTELNSIEIDEGALAVLESYRDDVVHRLQKSQRDFEDAKWDEKINEANSQLRSLEDKSAQVNSELVQSSRQAGDLAKLEFLRKELKDRERSLETMKNAHADKINAVLGEGWNISSLERDFQTVLEQRKMEVNDAERQREGTNRELEHLEFKIKSSRNDCKKKIDEMKACEARVSKAIDNEPVSEYADFVAQLEQSRDIRKSDVDNFSNLRKYYMDCLGIANDSNACRLCERPFKNEKDRTKLVTKLENNINGSIQKGLKDELKELEDDLKKSRSVSTTYDTYLRLSQNEIPQLESEIEKLAAKRESLLSTLEEQENLINSQTAVRRDVELLSRPVDKIAKNYQEIEGFKSQISALSEQQKGINFSRSLDEIENELASLSEMSRSSKNVATKLLGDKERTRGQINAFELELRDVNNKLTNATHLLEKKGDLLARVAEFQALNKQQQVSIERVEKETDELLPRTSEAQIRCDDIVQRGVGKERELQQEAAKISDTVRLLKSADDDINAYVKGGGPDQLARCQADVSKLRETVTELEEDQRQIAVEINTAQDKLKEEDVTKRNISDNIRYRRDLRALESLNEEITSLEEKNAEIDRDNFVREAEKWGLKQRKFSAEQASKMGAMKTKDDHLGKLIEDWETDYQDAAIKYKEAHIKVETAKAAVDDLDRYGGALDKAIMRYHSLKMEEINRITEELWKKTYQGTDVDTILIRSDNENMKGNQTYNYRVCMVKQDAEMDMRGRCSAGQRVLASIIIRLALAECFGVNCGLIALDEPTTNLDQDNIRALAESLHDIIKHRQEQSNFQLLVITHDEEFLRYMKCAEFCDSYYRVSRNDKQKSKIERQSIAEVA